LPGTIAAGRLIYGLHHCPGITAAQIVPVRKANVVAGNALSEIDSIGKLFGGTTLAISAGTAARSAGIHKG
jgi:hypothetical protein